MRSNIEVYYEPVQILNKLSDEYTAEMSDGQSAFLCGLLRKFSPEKIVEIGVAAGGTTAIILNCINLLKLKAKLFSVDLSENFYRDVSKKTGYLAEEFKAAVNVQPEHVLYTGKYAVECIDDIGKNIDFLILDTVHVLPGELLDFLAYYPYLKTGCVVVLHDTAMNQYSDNKDAYATRILLSSVTALKILYEDANIAAFVISEDTTKNIDDLFSALMVTWKYFPKQEELCLYRNFYSNYYTSENLKMFDLAVELNRKTVLRKVELKWNDFVKMYHFVNSIKGKRVYVYGCGTYGKQFYHILEECSIELGGYIVSDNQVVSENVKSIYYLSDLTLDNEHDIIFVGVNRSLWAEICAYLQQKGITNYILPDENIFEYLKTS